MKSKFLSLNILIHNHKILSLLNYKHYLYFLRILKKVDDKFNLYVDVHKIYSLNINVFNSYLINCTKINKYCGNVIIYNLTYISRAYFKVSNNLCNPLLQVQKVIFLTKKI